MTGKNEESSQLCELKHICQNTAANISNLTDVKSMNMEMGKQEKNVR
jgi:hypothetical protein